MVIDSAQPGDPFDTFTLPATAFVFDGLTGARAGTTERFDTPVVAVGRHPTSDFRFDPLQDLDVSARHAELRLVDGAWSVHDQGSTNGTFVNAQRVSNERVIRHGDLITFGANGPRVEVHLEPAAAVRTSTSRRFGFSMATSSIVRQVRCRRISSAL